MVGLFDWLVFGVDFGFWLVGFWDGSFFIDWVGDDWFGVVGLIWIGLVWFDLDWIIFFGLDDWLVMISFICLGFGFWGWWVWLGK